ncbi:hypothetical protein ACT89R_01600 [Rhodococcus qingshengii]
MTLEYCTVRLNLTALIIDGIDADDLPDDVPVSATLVIEPQVEPGTTLRYDDNGTQKLKALTPFDVEIGATGDVAHRGRQYVKVVAPTEEFTNFAELQYKVTFKNPKVGPRSLVINPIYFFAVAGGEINLADHINLAGPSVAVQIQRGPKGDKGNTGVGVSAIAVVGNSLVFDMTAGPDIAVAVPAIAAADSAAAAASGFAGEAKRHRDDAGEFKSAAAGSAESAQLSKEGIDEVVVSVNQTLTQYGTQFAAERQASERAVTDATTQAKRSEDAADISVGKAGAAAQSALDAKRFRDEAEGVVTGVSSFEGVTGAVTKAQVGLDKVDNTRDVDKEISGPTQQAITNLMEGVDAAFTGLSDRVDEKTTVTQAQGIAIAAIAAWVGNTPQALDTLEELAAALGNNPNFATDVLALIGTKAAGDHKHGTADITTGTLPVARGGIGRGSVVNGAYFRGVGTDAVEMRTAAQVLTDIGGAPTTHTHTADQVAGLVGTFESMSATLDYLNNIKLNASQIATVTALPGTLLNGAIYFVYTP